ncbi:MAG: hypothetical protein NXI18_02625 [Alphaproteobacteria bacterium]|nr:hypothetical protein [Alphaproteobacteria bacterium]
MWRRVLLALGIAATSGTAAAEGWRVEPVDPAAYPPEIVAETGDPAPDGLPDGRVARAPKGDIRAAWYIAPTLRYGHGILGDAVEAGGLRVQTADGAILSLVLPESEVFEDRTPLLADLDGDGRTEIVALRASLTAGGSVTVYGVDGNALVERGSTGFIGRSHRWLNVAGIADFLGEGGLQIAYVQTPHIGGTLLVYRLEPSGLSKVAELYGFSNHVIGATEQRLSAVADVDGDSRPDLALPSADRKTLRIVSIGVDGIREIANVPLPARVDKAILAEETVTGPRFVVGLDDGSVVGVAR